jgi:transposase InsO family protein
MMPNQLWVSDFTYVSAWQGFVYLAFVICLAPSDWSKTIVSA